MDKNEKLVMLKSMTDESDENILSTYLYLAAGIVLKRRYPFRDDVTEVPEKYVDNQLKIAAYLINKRGAEGQISHNENGISRSYESADVPESMLKGILPLCSAICKKEEEQV